MLLQCSAQHKQQLLQIPLLAHAKRTNLVETWGTWPCTQQVFHTSPRSPVARKGSTEKGSTNKPRPLQARQAQQHNMDLKKNHRAAGCASHLKGQTSTKPQKKTGQLLQNNPTTRPSRPAPSKGHDKTSQETPPSLCRVPAPVVVAAAAAALLADCVCSTCCWSLLLGTAGPPRHHRRKCHGRWESNGRQRLVCRVCDRKSADLLAGVVHTQADL